MTVLISIAVMLLGFWILWRVVSIDPQSQEKPYSQMSDQELVEASRARGIVLPKEFVGPTYRNTRHSGPHFWTEEEP